MSEDDSAKPTHPARAAHPDPAAPHARPAHPDPAALPARPASAPRPPHRQWALVALVAAGGTVGTAAREGLTLLFPTSGVPLTIGLINVIGAFLLGMLLATLGRRGPDAGRRRLVRLTFGTGVLGGFTTYSALAADTAGLLTGAPATSPTAGVIYAVVSVLLGAAAAWCGLRLGASRLFAPSRRAREAGDS